MAQSPIDIELERLESYKEKNKRYLLLSPTGLSFWSDDLIKGCEIQIDNVNNK